MPTPRSWRSCENSEGKSDETIRLANRVFDLALTDTGKRIYLRQGIDLLDALPAPDVFGIEAFAQENYPRQLERVRSRREQFARFLHRFEKPEGESG
jgi:hypothetical protein